MSTRSLILIKVDNEPKVPDDFVLQVTIDGYPFGFEGIMYKICTIKKNIELLKKINMNVPMITAHMLKEGWNTYNLTNILPTKLTEKEFINDRHVEYKYVISLVDQQIIIKFNDIKHRKLDEWIPICYNARESFINNSRIDFLSHDAYVTSPCKDCLVFSTCLSIIEYNDIYRIRKKCDKIIKFRNEYRKKLKKLIPKDLDKYVWGEE